MTVKLTLLDAGYCLHPEHITIRGGHWRNVRFPAMFALLEHPHFGPLLFDTGYSARFFKETKHFPYSLYRKITPAHLDEEEAAIYKLRERGFAATEIEYILISHFHADHIGALRDFPNARYLYFPHAFEAVRQRRGLRAVLAGFLPGLLPADFEERSQTINPARMAPLPPEYAPFSEGIDLFGDESLLAVSLPGHAEGQMGLFVQTDHQSPYFLVADACWHSKAYRELRLPHPITNLITSNPRLYRATLARLHQFHHQRPDIQILPSHCREVHAQYVQKKGENRKDKIA